MNNVEPESVIFYTNIVFINNLNKMYFIVSFSFYIFCNCVMSFCHLTLFLF